MTSPQQSTDTTRDKKWSDAEHIAFLQKQNEKLIADKETTSKKYFNTLNNLYHVQEEEIQHYRRLLAERDATIDECALRYTDALNLIHKRGAEITALKKGMNCINTNANNLENYFSAKIKDPPFFGQLPPSLAVILDVLVTHYKQYPKTI